MEIDRNHLELALKASGSGVWLWLVKEKRAIFSSVTKHMFLHESDDVDEKNMLQRALQQVHSCKRKAFGVR